MIGALVWCAHNLKRIEYLHRTSKDVFVFISGTRRDIWGAYLLHTSYKPSFRDSNVTP